MAIIKCAECKNDVSDDAESCPHCGKQMKKKESVAGVIFAAIFGYYILGPLFAIFILWLIFRSLLS